MMILPLTLAGMLMLLGLRFGWSGFVRLANRPLRGGAYALGASLAQVVSIVTQEHRFSLLLVSAALLACFCWLNRGRVGCVLAALGIALNLVVMAANDGTMPIGREQVMRVSGFQAQVGADLGNWKSRVLDDDVAKLAWLGDRLLLPGPLARLAAWSIGDVLLLTGVARLLWHTMKGAERDDSPVWGTVAPSRT